MRAPRWFRRLPMPTSLAHVSGSAWRMAGRLFALGAIAAMGFSVAVGAFSAIDSVFSARSQWYAQGHVADLELRVATTDAGRFPDFGDIPGVTDYRTRMVLTGALRQGESRSDVVSLLVISTVRDSAAPINSPVLVQGSLLTPGDRQGVVVERSLARYHDVAVGDTLDVELDERVVPLTVRGVVEDAEFLLAPMNPSMFVPSKGSLGVAYVDQQVLREHLGFTPGNSVLFRIPPDAAIPNVRQTILDRAATRLDGGYTVSRTEQFSYQFLEKDLGVFRIVLPVIVLVSALSAVFVTTFLLVQWVVRERQTLGVFMALGHSPGRLSVSFALVFAYLAVGAAIGGLLGAVVVGRAFIESFSTAIGLPIAPFAFTPRYLLLGALAVLAVFALAGGAAIRRVFLMSPRDAMRYTTPSGGAPGVMGRWVGSRLPTTWLRMALRNLFRNRLVSLVTIVSVGLGFGVTAAFFIAYSSFVATSIDNVDRGTWDLAVDFTAPVEQTSLDEISREPGVREVVPYTKGVAQTSRNGTRVNLYIGAFDPARPWQVETMLSGHRLSADEPDGMLLEQSTARKLGVDAGDTLTLQAEGKHLQARVVGVFSGALPGEAHLPIGLYDRLAGLGGRVTGCFVRVQGDVATVGAELGGRPDVQQVLSKEQISSEILGASGQVTGILRLGAIISIGIAGLFVFSCLGYTVLQRKSEYQALRVLGYSNRLITGIILTEVLALGAAALALAVPVGAVTAAYLNGRLSAAWFHVDTIITAKDYLTTFVPALALLPLVALPIAWTVLREPLEVHLRTRDIA